MVVNNYTITINAPIVKVWQALTTSEPVKAWTKNVEVESDWQQGSKITYTCFDKPGKVSQWAGMDMIWEGEIETIEPNKEFTCVYPVEKTGLAEETYKLEELGPEQTKVTFEQHCADAKVAAGYAEGADDFHNMLKTYLET